MDLKMNGIINILHLITPVFYLITSLKENLDSFLIYLKRMPIQIQALMKI